MSPQLMTAVVFRFVASGFVSVNVATTVVAGKGTPGVKANEAGVAVTVEAADAVATACLGASRSRVGDLHRERCTGQAPRRCSCH